MATARTALITGGAKRVGRAVATRLHAGGMNVAITYQSSAADALVLCDELNAKGPGRAIAVEADLAKPDVAAETIFAAVNAAFGRLDVLVNSASVYTPGSLAELDLKSIQKIEAVNMHAPLLLIQKFATTLRQNHGHVVNMLDIQAERPWPRYLAYCASKAALWNLTLSLARELAPEVTVNGIAPGVVDWPADMPEAERAKYLQRVPLARAGTPADVAETVEFLTRQGSYVTGQVIRLDGGRSLL